MHLGSKCLPKDASSHPRPAPWSVRVGAIRRSGRRLLLVAAGLACGVSLIGSEPHPAHTVSRDIVLDPSQVTVAPVSGWSQVDVRGGTRGVFPSGSPDLPALAVHLEVPDGMRPVAAKMEVLASETLPGRHSVPAVAPARREPVVLSAPAVPGHGWFPSELVHSVRPGRMRGKSLAAVVVCPVTWNSESGALRLATRFRVTVDLENVSSAGDMLRLERESPDGQRTFDDAFTRLLGAPPLDRSRLSPRTLPSGPFAPGFRPTVDGSPVDMVIVTTTDQEAEYQRLATFHTQTGLMTVVRTVSWIEANYPRGADRAETIRNFIRDAVSKWGTAWILIGGDVDQVPVRHSHSEGFGWEEVSSDLYYSDLDRNWNEDGDAFFGEGDAYNQVRDNVDLYPDVWVGRLSSGSTAQAKILVDKTLAYLQNPPLGYQKDALFLAEVLFPDSWEPGQSAPFDGATLAETVVDSLPPHMRAVRMYENYTAWPGSLPEQKPAVLDSLDAGFHLVHIVAHGFITTISVGLGHQTLNNLDAASLTNGGEQFLLFTMDCTSSAIDFNCIAEQFLLNPGGGAFASVGATEVEFPTTAYVYEQEFYDLVLNGGATEIGRALALSRVPFVPYSEEDSPHRWTQLSLILLGDPSLKFSTTVPKVLNVSHASTFTLGANSFAVSVTQNGQPLANARVTLTKDGDEYVIGTSNLFGQAVIPFRPDLTGSFCVGVTAPGCLPKLTNATVVAPSGKAYVFASTQTLSDGTTGSMNGNGDGRLDAGETVEVRFGIKNQGSLTASGVTASLSSTDPYLTLLDAASTFANVPPGGTISASDPMLIRVSRSAPDRYEAHATLTINGTNGPFVEDVVFWVHAPVIEYYAQTVDGIIQPNVDLLLRPTLRNAGAGRLRSASLRLRSQDPAVILSDTVVALGNVLPGATATHPTDSFRVRFTNLTGPHPVTLAVVDAYGQVFSRKIDVFAPGTASGLAGSTSSSSVTLTWAKVPDSDLWGYAIYRSATPGGTFTRINPWTVLRTSLFEDGGLPPFTSYSYKVAAVDSSGNEGPRSTVTTLTTKLPLHAGWPVDTGASTPAGVCLTDLNGDGDLEILGGGLEMLAFAPDGGDFHNGDQNAITRGPITNVQGEFWSTPAVGDLKGDGNLAVAAIGFKDLKLHVVTPEGAPLPGWPKTVDIPSINDMGANPVGSVCLGDIDADGELEIFATVGKIIFGWRANGAEIRDGDGNPGTGGVFALTGAQFSYGTPSVANVDADPYRELIAGMRDGKLYVYRHDGTPYPNFPWDAGGDITTGPAVADLNLDGRKEIVFGTSNGFVHALHTDLTQSFGFPKPVPLLEDWDSSPALGDVNGDGAPDVAIGGSDGFLYVLNGMNGSAIPGFRVNLGVTTRSSPAIADIDGNGSVDILIGDRNGRLHAFNNAGVPITGFPVQTGNRIENGPAVGDVDGDGLTEVVVQSFDQKIHVWDTPWTFNPARAPWPMYKGNPRHTGALGDPAFVAAATGVPEGGTLPLILRAAPNPFRTVATLAYRVPASTVPAAVDLVVYDLSGRAVRRLVSGDQAPGEHEVTWNGTNDANQRVAPGMYVYRLAIGPSKASGKLVLLP